MSATTPSHATRDTTRAALVAGAVAVAVALPSIVNGFVYDDVFLIVRNAVVHDLDSIGTLLTAPYWPEEHGSVMWRPLALLAFAVEWAVGGGRPLIFHAVNIALYGLVSALVGLLVARLFGGRIGLLAGVLFAVHPVHVEVTANAVGQADLWAAAGFVAALLAVLERSTRADAGRTTLLVAGLLAFAVALGGKEHVVTFPAAAVVVWWIVARQRAVRLGDILRREWLVLVGCGALIVVYLFLRARFAVGITEAGGINDAFVGRSALGRLVVMLPVSLEWLSLLFVPIALAGDYSIQHMVPQPEFGLVHAAALTVWVALAWLAWRRRHALPAVFAGFVLFVALMSVYSSVVVPLQILFAERFLFLPSLGWAVAVAGLIAAAGTRLAVPSRPVWLGAGVVVVLLAARSVQRATVWRSNEVFFVQLLSDAPTSYRSHWAVASHAFTRGDSVLGERELKAAIQLNPTDARLYEHLGRVYAASERYAPAIPLLEQAIALDSTRLPASLALALALARSGRAEEGLEVLDTATKIHGEEPGLLVVRGEVLKRAGQPLAALFTLERAIEHDPKLWRVHVMAAEAAAMAGRCAAAFERLDAIAASVPESGRADVAALKSWVANGNAPCK